MYRLLRQVNLDYIYTTVSSIPLGKTPVAVWYKWMSGVCCCCGQAINIFQWISFTCLPVFSLLWLSLCTYYQSPSSTRNMIWSFNCLSGRLKGRRISVWTINTRFFFVCCCLMLVYVIIRGQFNASFSGIPPITGFVIQIRQLQSHLISFVCYSGWWFRDLKNLVIIILFALYGQKRRSSLMDI